jgi:signal transduction histidine kinase
MPAESIRNRFFSRTALPIFAVGAVLLAAGIYGAWRVNRLHKRGNDMLSDNVASIRTAERLETITREIRHRLKRHLSSGNDRHLEDIEDLLPRGLTALREAEELAISAREEQVVKRTREHYERLRLQFNRLQSEPSSIVRQETMHGMADHLIPNRIIAGVDEYIGLNEQSLDRSSQRNQSTANQLMFGLLLLGTCGGVAGLIAGYGIAHRVNRTIVQLAIPIQDTAGKLSQVAGPVTWTAEPGFEDLESVLKSVSDHVATVVERLQESERDRLRAEQLAAVGQLAAGLAHELRNPLTSMKAILQLASQPRELTNRDLQVLREETNRLEDTAQSLLDFAKPPQLHAAATNLGQQLEQSVALVERRCERKGITLRYQPGTTGITVSADAAKLRQVIVNLLLNSVDATPRDGTIVLDCQREESSGTRLTKLSHSQHCPEHRSTVHWVVIRVADTGRGLPQQLGERIFDPFVTTKETGAGLGLSICKQIVACHGGTLSAKNRSECGAVFEVRLPLESDADSLRTRSPAVANGAEL